MNALDFALSFALNLMGQQKLPEDEVRAQVKQRFPEVIDEFDAWLEDRRRSNMIMSIEPQWRGQVVRDLSRTDAHYPGPHPGMNVAWPVTERAIEARVGPGPLRRIDSQSTDVVASLARPNAPLASRRGLVVGHVQSGKTANFTATIAKSADWGYSLVIVLAGLHTALRQQTQDRLDEDLVEALRADRRENDWSWHWLTESDADFSTPRGTPDALLQSNGRMIAVVKKNVKRLRSLVDWLGTADEAVRQRSSVLLIDDESDQASVNTRSNDRSAINRLIVELLEVMPSTSYVGFTATPYANVLIDPSDEADLYPRDFIIALEQPDGYQGSEVLFGRNELDGEEPIDGYDIVRTVAPADIERILPPNRKEDREAFSPEMVPSLEEALRWFLLATAARRARGQSGHSSCLVHTSRYVDQHFLLAREITNWLRIVDADASVFRHQWNDEAARQTPPTTGIELTFDDVHEHLGAVLEDVEVAIDNGRASEDQRLSYSDDEPSTVIAVGGDTLSRGLTLEGLVSSYFVRRSRTYDALMQMGRWFGFRPGYEDLTRLWTDPDTMRAFRHLSTVEREIRDDIASYDVRTPKELALRIRTHPTLAVTSPGKMRHAIKAQISYAGSRMQTTFFNAHDSDWLDGNKDAADLLIDRIDGNRRIPDPRDGVAVWHDVAADHVENFLATYGFHSEHAEMRSDLILRWLRRRRDHGDPVTWNVAVLGRGNRHMKVGDARVDLGTTNFADLRFNNINRAPLRDSVQPANIGALMSRPDRVVDLPGIDGDRRAKLVDADRARVAPGRGLLALYPISPKSTPLKVSTETRRDLEAAGPVIGVGLYLPRPTTSDGIEDLVEAEYVSAYIAGEDDLTDEYEEQLLRGELDDERDAQVDVGNNE